MRHLVIGNPFRYVLIPLLGALLGFFIELACRKKPTAEFRDLVAGGVRLAANCLMLCVVGTSQLLTEMANVHIQLIWADKAGDANGLATLQAKAAWIEVVLTRVAPASYAIL